MSSTCIRCGEHVPSGQAFLVLSGTYSDGTFVAKGPEAVAHALCISGATVRPADYPVTFVLA